MVEPGRICRTSSVSRWDVVESNTEEGPGWERIPPGGRNGFLSFAGALVASSSGSVSLSKPWMMSLAGTEAVHTSLVALP